MTEIHYIVVGLVALAGYLYRTAIARVLSPQAAAQPQAGPPTVRILDTPATTIPIDTRQLGALLHQAVTAEATNRAITRGMEEMIDTHSRKVQLPWTAPAPPAAGGTEVPKG